MTKSNEDNGEFYECMRLRMSCGTRPITHEKIKQTVLDETSRERKVFNVLNAMQVISQY